MQRGRALAQQLCAQVADDFEPEGLDRCGVVAKGLQPQPNPARNLAAAIVGKAHQSTRIGDRHDAGNHRRRDADLAAFFDEAPIGVGVEEHLRDRVIGTGVHFGREGAQIVLRAARLRMHFRVAGHGDVEMRAGFLADEAHQIAAVLQFTWPAIAARQVAAQGHQAFYAHGLELL